MLEVLRLASVFGLEHHVFEVSVRSRTHLSFAISEENHFVDERRLFACILPFVERITRRRALVNERGIDSTVAEMTKLGRNRPRDGGVVSLLVNPVAHLLRRDILSCESVVLARTKTIVCGVNAQFGAEDEWLLQFGGSASLAEVDPWISHSLHSRPDIGKLVLEVTDMYDISRLLSIQLLVNILFESNLVLVVIKHDFLLLFVPADCLEG